MPDKHASSTVAREQATACQATLSLADDISRPAALARQAAPQGAQGLLGMPVSALTLLRAGTLSSKLLLSGGLAGALSRTVTAPIDRLKFLLQVQEGRPISVVQVVLRAQTACCIEGNNHCIESLS